MTYKSSDWTRIKKVCNQSDSFAKKAIRNHGKLFTVNVFENEQIREQSNCFSQRTPCCVAMQSVVQSLSSVHFGGVGRARARRGRISLESETGRVLTVYV